MSTKSFLYTGAKTVDALRERAYISSLIDVQLLDGKPGDIFDPETPPPEPFTILRTNDTEKRLTEEEENGD